MVKRKWLALLLILMLGIGTLTGCSPTEKGYYNLLKEASSQKIYTNTGSIELSVAQLPASLGTGPDAINEEIFRKAIDKYRIEYSGRVDVNQDACQYDFYIVDKITAAKQQITSLVYKNDVLYVKLDTIFNYLQQVDSMEKADLDKLSMDMEWLKITDEDLRNMDPKNTTPPMISDMFQRSARQQSTVLRLSDGLINDVYAGYSPGLVSEMDSQYTFTLRGSQLIGVMKPAATYTINNIDKLGMVLKAFINSLSPAELSDFYITNEAKVRALQGIDLMVAEVTWNRAKYLSEIENTNVASEQKFLNIVNDSEVVFTLKKTDANTYDRSTLLHLNLTAGNPTDKINLTIISKDSMKTSNTVAITAPTAKVITLTELNKRTP